MAVKTEQVEKNLVKVVFEVSAEDFEAAIKKVYAKNAKKYSVPGFRKGKVPRAVIEKYYTAAVFYDDAINLVLPEAYEAAIKEADLEPVARPELDVDEIVSGKPVVFTALVTTKPDVTLGDYKGLKIAKIEHTVTDEDVTREIESVQKRNARLVPVEDRAAENGDIAVIDFEGFADGVAFDGGKGEGYELELGSGSFIPGFEEQLVGKNAGDDVEVNVTFPTEYHADNLAGKDAMFKVKIHELKKKELPELDDDFASEVSEFETLDEYKNSIKERLEKDAENKTKTETENAVIEKACENAEVDIPAAMIEAQMDTMVQDFAQRLQYQGMNLEMYMKYTGSTHEAFREGFREQAEKQTKTMLVLDAICKAENVDVTDEEVNDKIAEMAKMYNMELDKLTELITDAEKENIKNDVQMGKTIDLLVNKSKIK
ncbi:MAG: trigger factor [Eubacteriales bacterium]|nr:trigger factor [Eubacteriales bacterium]